eukprot:365743-Chlamydomonas_euryale.AAC.20
MHVRLPPCPHLALLALQLADEGAGEEASRVVTQVLGRGHTRLLVLPGAGGQEMCGRQRRDTRGLRLTFQTQACKAPPSPPLTSPHIPQAAHLAPVDGGRVNGAAGAVARRRVAPLDKRLEEALGELGAGFEDVGAHATGIGDHARDACRAEASLELVRKEHVGKLGMLVESGVEVGRTPRSRHVPAGGGGRLRERGRGKGVARAGLVRDTLNMCVAFASGRMCWTGRRREARGGELPLRPAGQSTCTGYVGNPSEAH